MTVEVAKRILSHQIRLQNATTRIFAFDFGQKKNLIKPDLCRRFQM